VSERETEGGEREGETMNREPHQLNNKLERSYDKKEGGESFSPGSHLKAPLRLIMCSLLESCGAASSPSSFSSDKRETFCVVKRIIEIPRVISTEINISEQERRGEGRWATRRVEAVANQIGRTVGLLIGDGLFWFSTCIFREPEEA
jgi:hypothetical protein